MAAWKLQEAEASCDEVFDRALSGEPQFVMRNGKPSVIDSQIAATAIACDMVLVTRNVKDMAGTGVRMLNPFSQN